MRRALSVSGLCCVLSLASCTGDEVTTPEDEQLRYAYAPGIRLTRLTINQGVQVELVNGEQLRQADDYGVELLAGRTTLVRAHYAVHHEFATRELLAQLTVSYPEDSGLEPYVDDSIVEVSGDSYEGSLRETFAWLLPPEQVVEGMQLRVDAYETRSYGPDESLPPLDFEAEGAARIDAPALPWVDDVAAVELTPTPMELEVVLVPVEHHFDGCVSDASVPEAEVEILRDALDDNNPVQRVEMRVREPIIWEQSVSEGPGFSPILTRLSQVREDDGVGPQVYYYGLITTCDGFPPGLAGQAIGIPSEPLPELAYQRVSAGRWANQAAPVADTFVHEVGHSQGRRHVRCTGGEAGIDPAYPHPGGVTGVWGFGVNDRRLRSPSGARDYMTYCGNEFVSDYGWRFVWPVIETLTSWTLDDDDGREGDGFRTRDRRPSDFDEILVGALYEDGSQDWWTTRGGVTGAASEQYWIDWQLDGETLRLPAWISPRSEGDTLNVASVLPRGDLADARFAVDSSDAAVEAELALAFGRAVDFADLRRAPR